MTVTTRSGSTSAPSDRADAEPGHRLDRAAEPRRVAGGVGQRREHDHDDELRQEQARLRHDHAGRVVPAVPCRRAGARQQHVGVGDHEEREQRVRAVHGLPQYFLDLLGRTAGRPRSRNAAQQRRVRRRRARDRSWPTSSDGWISSAPPPNTQPPDTDRRVHGGQLGPALAALQYAELRAHQGQPTECRREQQDGDAPSRCAAAT